MDSTEFDLGELVQHLPGAAPFEVRIALKAGNAGWRVDCLVAVCQSGQAAAARIHYDYGDIRFIRDNVSGKDLSDWIRKGTGRVGDLSFTIDETYPHVYSYHIPSLVRWGLFCLQTPSHQYVVKPRENRPGNHSRQMLISDGAPLFPSYEEALFELLYGDPPGMNRNSVPSEYIQIIVPDRRARISGVRIFPTRLEVGVAGEIPERLSLHITGSGPTFHTEIAVDKCGVYHTHLPLGASSRFVCALAEGRNLLDARHIDSSLGQVFRADDVVLDHEEDPAEGIQALIARGEGPTVEFKEDWPSHSDKYLKTIVAFANGLGGKLVFGVNDDGVAIGVPGEARTYVESINNAVAASIEPTVNAQVQAIEVGKRTLIVVQVPESDHRLYALSSQDKFRYYKRVGSSTSEFRPDELQLNEKGNGQPALKLPSGYSFGY